MLLMVTIFLLGVLATNAEPALNVLGATVQRLSAGKFTKRMLIGAVCAGVGVGMCVGEHSGVCVYGAGWRAGSGGGAGGRRGVLRPRRLCGWRGTALGVEVGGCTKARGARACARRAAWFERAAAAAPRPRSREPHPPKKTTSFF